MQDTQAQSVTHCQRRLAAKFWFSHKTALHIVCRAVSSTLHYQESILWKSFMYFSAGTSQLKSVSISLLWRSRKPSRL